MHPSSSPGLRQPLWDLFNICFGAISVAVMQQPFHQSFFIVSKPKSTLQPKEAIEARIYFDHSTIARHNEWNAFEATKKMVWRYGTVFFTESFTTKIDIFGRIRCCEWCLQLVFYQPIFYHFKLFTVVRCIYYDHTDVCVGVCVHKQSELGSLEASLYERRGKQINSSTADRTNARLSLFDSVDVCIHAGYQLNCARTHTIAVE